MFCFSRKFVTLFLHRVFSVWFGLFIFGTKTKKKKKDDTHRRYNVCEWVVAFTVVLGHACGLWTKYPLQGASHLTDDGAAGFARAAGAGAALLVEIK